MHITAEVALYPTESVDADHVINESIEASLSMGDVQYEVGPVSTELSGHPDEVWQALRHMFDEATTRGGEVSMSVTVTNARR